jgi:GT2 family glycosyltransferase
MYSTTVTDVSIIIVSYNTCRLTVECINSVMQKTNGINFEIIVVDNASSDGSANAIKEKFPVVTVIENSENIGFGNANNIGAKAAKGEFLLLLNSDTVLSNNAIKIFTEYMRSGEGTKAGICGGNLFAADKKPNHSYSAFYPSLWKIFLYRSGLFTRFYKPDVFNYSENNKEVPIIIGADLFVRKKIFDELGGFDPAFFMYVEDGELCYRVKKAGYNIVSVPAAEIIHYQGKSSTTGQKLVMEVTSYMHYFRKHHSRFILVCYRQIELFFAVAKFVFFIFSRHKRKAYFELIKFLLK